VKKLFLGNLAFGTTSEDLNELCSQFGQVTSAKVATDRDSGQSRGFGFVEMQDGADAAIEALNNKDFKGRNLTVNEARPKDASPRTGGFSRGGGGGGGGDRGGDRGGYRR
jgi:RNA recognition motif-containing protein